MKRRFYILSSVWFIVPLLLLLLNDLILKEMYGNWLTGKLSDFAGLFVFSLFWTALFPKWKNYVFLFTAIFFVYWKSTYSDGFIEIWNTYAPFQVARVVDPTDLLALFVLPFAYRIEQVPVKRLKISPVFPLVVASFSFIATSYHTEIEVGEKYAFGFSKEKLKEKIIYLNIIEDDFLRESLSGLGTSENDSIHRSKINSLLRQQISLKQLIPDTAIVFISEDFCFDGYGALLQIDEIKILIHYCNPFYA